MNANSNSTQVVRERLQVGGASEQREAVRERYNSVFIFWEQEFAGILPQFPAAALISGATRRNGVAKRYFQPANHATHGLLRQFSTKGTAAVTGCQTRSLDRGGDCVCREAK